MIGHKEHANTGKITLNKDTYTEILDKNLNRTNFTICNLSVNEFVLIALCPMGDAVKPVGITIQTEKCKDFPLSGETIYTGKVCGISDDGDAEITFTEY
jgi:hypothetical protein